MILGHHIRYIYTSKLHVLHIIKKVEQVKAVTNKRVRHLKGKKKKSVKRRVYNPNLKAFTRYWYVLKMSSFILLTLIIKHTSKPGDHINYGSTQLWR